MTKIKKLNKLFSKWDDDIYKVFMKDGIIDKEKYEGLMLILKDVNNAKPDDVNDMRVDVKTSTSGGKTWFDIASWTAGLLDDKLLTEITHDIQHEQLSRVAIMNLKKEAGRSSSSKKEIQYYTDKDIDYILEEIKICNPKLIIACSHDVFNALAQKLKISRRENCDKIVFNEKMKDYGLYFDISKHIGAKKPVYVVEYRHPNQCGRQGTREEHYKNMRTIRKSLAL